MSFGKMYENRSSKLLETEVPRNYLQKVSGGLVLFVRIRELTACLPLP